MHISTMPQDQISKAGVWWITLDKTSGARNPCVPEVWANPVHVGSWQTEQRRSVRWMERMILMIKLISFSFSGSNDWVEREASSSFVNPSFTSDKPKSIRMPLRVCLEYLMRRKANTLQKVTRFDIAVDDSFRVDLRNSRQQIAHVILHLFDILNENIHLEKCILEWRAWSHHIRSSEISNRHNCFPW